MKKLLFVANHTPPAELANDWEVVAICDNPELKALWANIPKYAVEDHISPLVGLMLENGYKDIVVVGEPRACFALVKACHGVGAKAYSTYSVRDSIDEVQPDGSVLKKAIFRFEGLVEYPYNP